MFSNFLAVITDRMFGSPEPSGATQREENPSTATDGVLHAQGFVPVLMQLLPNPVQVPVSLQADIADMSVAGNKEENTASTGFWFTQAEGKKGEPAAIIRFPDVTGLLVPVDRDMAQPPTGSNELVKLSRSRRFNVTQDLSFSSPDKKPVLTQEAPSPPSAEIGQPGLINRKESAIARGIRPGHLLEGMPIIPERASETHQPVSSYPERGRTENILPDKPSAQLQSLKPARMPEPDNASYRDVGPAARQSGSEKSETQERPPQTPGTQVTDLSERLKDNDSVKTRGEGPDIDKPASPLESLPTRQHGQTASPAGGATKGETAHTALAHLGVHTVQTGATNDIVTGPPALQQTQVLPTDIARSVIDQVARELAQRIGGQVSEIRLMLKPEALGELALKVKVENGAMTAQIDVTQANVKAALESNLADLRMALQSRGIEVRSIDIFSHSEMASNAGGQTPSRSHSHGRRRHGFESPERYQSSRQLGYNTIEFIM